MTRNRSLTEGGKTGGPVQEASSGAEIRQALLANLPVRERRMELNGVSTAVLEGGEGPPVVLLHGPGEYAAKWLRVMPDLTATRRVIAPDLPGHGASAAPADPPGVEWVLDWLDDLIERTCPAPPALVGHVLGGAIAARYASDRGERLSRLVLVDSLGLAEFQPAPEFGKALGDFLAQPDEDTHDRLWSHCAYDLDALRENLGNRWGLIKAYNLDRARAADLHETQQALMGQFGLPAIPPSDLAGIAVPTSLIWGRHDLATRLPVAQKVADRFGWTLRVIEDAADDPPLEQPGMFLEALRAALDDA